VIFSFEHVSRHTLSTVAHPCFFRTDLPLRNLTSTVIWDLLGLCGCGSAVLPRATAFLAFGIPDSLRVHLAIRALMARMYRGIALIFGGTESIQSIGRLSIHSRALTVIAL
jgi:hypothetical protein